MKKITDLGQYKQERLEAHLDSCADLEEQLTRMVASTILQYVHSVADDFEVSDALVHEAIINTVLFAAESHIRSDQEPGFKSLLNDLAEDSERLLQELDIKADRDSPERKCWHALLMAHRWRGEKAE